MLPDRVSNPGPLTYESGALPIALRGPAITPKIWQRNMSISFFLSTSIFFFKFVACAVPTDKSHGRQMLNGYKACSPYESGSSRRLIYIHYHDCVYSKNQQGFSKIIIIRLGYQHSMLHKSRSQKGTAPPPPPPPPLKKKKKKKKNFHPQTLAAHI